MNDNNIKFEGNGTNTYRATSNLNTAIENPEVNIDSAMDVNIEDVDDNINNVSSNLNINVNNNIGYVDNNVSEQNINRSSFQDISSNSFVFQNQGQQNTSNLNTANTLETNNSNDYVAAPVNENVVYEPTMKTKKKNGVTIKVNRELKVMIFIVFILLAFIFVIPYIYDFFKELQLVITTR